MVVCHLRKAWETQVLQLLTAFGGPRFFEQINDEAYPEDKAEQLIVACNFTEIVSRAAASTLPGTDPLNLGFSWAHHPLGNG